MADHTTPNDATRQADRDALKAEHGAPQAPSSDEEQAADANQVDGGVKEHYEDMVERGAHQQGEGRLP
jgi:hypothetical protein